MTESKRTRQALEAVQRQWPLAVIYKFNDRSTKGIPDALIMFAGTSIWLEFKDADKETPEALMGTPRGKLQHYEMRRLTRAGAYAFLVVFRGKDTFVYNGNELRLMSDSQPLATFLAGLPL